MQIYFTILIALNIIYLDVFYYINYCHYFMQVNAKIINIYYLNLAI